MNTIGIDHNLDRARIRKPSYMLLIVFWLPMMIIQFKAFSKGFTPYPRRARWFCVLIGIKRIKA